MFRLHVLELAGLALFALVTFGLVVFAHTHWRQDAPRGATGV